MLDVAVCSDLHFEFVDDGALPATVAGFVGDLPRADVLVLAGDIHTCPAAGVGVARAAIDAGKAKHVVMVLGNHEFYESTLEGALARWREEADKVSGVHLLEDSDTRIEGVRFVGCTLWSDFEDADDASMLECQLGIVDYKLIRVRDGDGRERRATPADTLAVHRRSVEYLRLALAESEEPTVVVTHHLPTYKSVSARFRGDTCNGAFYSNLDWLIVRHPHVKLWAHGHTHASADHVVGATRVLCNPRGYCDENRNFKTAVVATVN